MLRCSVLAITFLVTMTIWVAAAAAVASFSVTGRVTDAVGNPVQGTTVELYRNTLPGWPWFSAANTDTDANGEYTINYLGYWNSTPPTPDIGYAGTYAVLFHGPAVGTDHAYYRPQWWSGIQGYFSHPDVWQWDWQAANIATTFDSGVSGLSKANVNAALIPYAGTIDCTVRDAVTGLPLANVAVTLFHFDTITVSDKPYQAGTVYTDANGRFTYVAGPTLAPNSWWTLLFNKAGYVKSWLGSVPYQTSVSDSTQAAQATVTHFQVASNQTSTITMTLAQPDTTAPSTTVAVSPAGAWSKTPVTVAFSATDNAGGSGVAYTEYSLDGGAYTHAAQCVVNTPGSHSIAVRSADKAGNVEVAKTVTVAYDNIGPVTTALTKVTVKQGRKATFRFKVADVTPTAGVQIKIYKGTKLKRTLTVGSKPTGSAQTYKWTCKLAPGTYTWKVYATDLAGNAQKTIGKKALVVN